MARRPRRRPPATRITARRSKEQGRRPRIADNLRTMLLEAWSRQGKPLKGKLIDRSVMSGEIARPAKKSWDRAGLNRLTLRE